MALIRSIATIGGLTATSRVLGFIRDVLIAAFLGASTIADAYVVALRLPNLFRSLFAEGAFSAAFVPTYVATMRAEGEAKAWHFAQLAGTWLFIVLVIFVGAGVVAMPWLISLMAPGFVGSEAFNLAVTFTRITFPYLLFISLTALLAGVLNSHDRFAAPAAAPILLNICMMAALLALGPILPTYGHALAWGLAIAGIVQFVWLYSNCASIGHWFTLTAPRFTPEVRSLLSRALPVVFGAGVHQINILVGTILASLLPVGSVSYLFYADRVGQLPFGIIAVAVGTALLPTLSRQLSDGQPEHAMNSLNRALEFAFLLMLPATAALVVLSEPIISVLFGRGAFGPLEVENTASALAVYALGLPALLLIKALTPAFFARGDTTTPVKAALAAAVVNVCFSVVLMQFFLHVGIAFASSLAVSIYAGVLWTILSRRGQLILDQRLKRRLPRTLAATLGMAAFLSLILVVSDPWLARDFSLRIPTLAVVIIAGATAYGGLAYALGAARFEDIRTMLARRSAT